MIATTDPISDMLTRIRNAALVRKEMVEVPHSKAKEALAKTLAASGYIDSLRTRQSDGRKTLEIIISSGGQPAVFTSIKRLSRPGRRLYVQAKGIPIVKRGRGIVIISTSQGMMSGDQAAKKGLGGELICEVY